MTSLKLYDIYGTEAELDISRSGYIRIDFKQSGEFKDKPQEFVFSMNTQQAEILKSAVELKLKEVYEL